MPTFLLISPPWQTPTTPSLAEATLRPILAEAGIRTEILYGAMLAPLLLSEMGSIERMGIHLFAPFLSPELSPERVVDDFLAVHLDEINLRGILYPPESVTFSQLGIDRDALRVRLLADIPRAGICLDRCEERALRIDTDVVGFSATFGTQLPATIALARRLRQARPHLRILLGGAACYGEQADGLISSFRCFDAICYSEGERTIVPLVRAMRGEHPLDEVPGIVFRAVDGTVRRTAPPRLIEELDRLPVPDYRPFLAQFAASDWSALSPKLLFETSRGCWWGQKRPCTFCGLNPRELVFRRKSPERAYDEIVTLQRRHPEAGFLQATDNVLDTDYIRTVLPRLAARRRRAPGLPRLFYEVRCTLRPHQLAVMSAAGIRSVQPGVESFHDDILRLMNKGTSGIGQIQFLKWLMEAGIEPVYNLILRNPGEKAAWYREMMVLIPAISHLPPPTGVTPMLLERFSPYHKEPAAFGIENLRPRDYYRLVYREPSIDLMRVAYEYDFDHEMHRDAELLAAHRAYTHAVMRWKRGWIPNLAFCSLQPGRIVVCDRRAGRDEWSMISGQAAAIYRFIDQMRPLRVILREFPALKPAFVRSLLETWVGRRWACRDGKERYLAVLPWLGRRGPRDQEATARSPAISSATERA